MSLKSKQQQTTGSFSATTEAVAAKHDEMVNAMHARWRSRSIAIPTDDRLVMWRLRELRCPIVLFGESPEERRSRLREELARVGSDEGFPQFYRDGEESEEGSSSEYDTDSSDSEREESEFVDLKDEKVVSARKRIVVDSLRCAEMRMKRIKLEEETDKKQEGKAVRGMSVVGHKLVISLSQVGGERPLSSGALSRDGNTVIVGGRDGRVSLWDGRRGEERCVLHSGDGTGNSLLSCMIDERGKGMYGGGFANGDIVLWDSEGKEVMRVDEGHRGGCRGVRSCSEGFLVTCGEDRAMKLWDIQKKQCIVTHKGATTRLRALDVHPDHNIVATGGDDCCVRLWDLRCGRVVGTYEGHARCVSSLSWGWEGLWLASGSGDNSIRLWDVRKGGCVGMIPAHKGGITGLVHGRTNNGAVVMVSGSLDKTVKLWGMSKNGCGMWELIDTLKGHDGGVVGVGLSTNKQTVVLSVSTDRTWKLWE